MKPLTEFVMLSLLVFAYFALSNFLDKKRGIVKIGITRDSYFANGRQETLTNVIKILKSYESQGYEICLEFDAVPERLTAVTDMTRSVEFKSKRFINSQKCL